MPPTVWDRLSSGYDRQLWLERSAVRTAVAMLEPVVDARVLDVATGTGEVLRALARRPAPPRIVIGIDASARMLAHVGGLPAGWSVRVGDARALPFADGEFDLVTASHVLHVLDSDDRARALGEIHRVLTPGGRVVTVTPAVPPRGLARPVARVLDRIAARGPERYVGLRAFDPRASLRDADLDVQAARWNLRGYPSVCVLARRSAQVIRPREPERRDSNPRPPA